MKKILTLVIAFFMVASVFVPATAEISYADEEFKIRTTMPGYSSTAGKKYYYTDDNVFYKHNLGPDRVYHSSYGGYCVGNCTWYAYGRASEILGMPLNSEFRWSASQWWNTNKKGNYYPYGSKPKVGAIACYSTHVAIVEKVVDGQPYVSESGWKVSKEKPEKVSSLKFNYGKPWCSNPKGYIYILDAPEVKDADYTVKISVSDLNMRTGPGTGYDRVGYAPKGTYDVVKECGNWVQLKKNEYWVCLDYVTVIEEQEKEKEQEKEPEKVVDEGTIVNYKVKVKIKNLNMRTGPGIDYEAKGFIKPGTYTIIKKKNGWGKIKSNGYWISLEYTEKVEQNTSEKIDEPTQEEVKKELYTVRINTDALNMRTGPGTKYSSKGVVVYGSKYKIKDTKNGWGQLNKNGYWIKLSYTVKAQPDYKVKVTVTKLNMRTGPGTKYKSKGYIKTGTHTITETKNGWGKVKSNGYWIKLSYTTKI